MSKIVRGTEVGAFTDSLQTAGAVRATALRSRSKTPTARDNNREAGRREGADIGRMEGMAAGFKEGRNNAYADAKREHDLTSEEQVRQFVHRVDVLLQEFEAQRTEFFKKAEDALASLAIEIAKRAIAQDLQISRESLCEIAHSVMVEATESASVKLRINPMDSGMMEARSSDLQSAFAHIENVEIVEDRSIDFGCKLETDLGLIDARVEDFLARIVERAREGN